MADALDEMADALDEPPRPFTVHVPDEVLADLRARIAATRWPSAAPGNAWEQGADLGYLRGLLAYWADGFDWRRREQALNAYRHFTLDLDGVPIHFVHHRARHGNGVPLILSHGWPSAFTEYVPLVAPLTDPAGHGLTGPAFDVVIPSLPGYGFSGRPATPTTYRRVADLWHRLMRRLGYRRYGAGGADFGAGVSTVLAMDHPDEVIGLHLTTIEPDPYHGEGAPPLTEAEERYLAHNEAWWRAEGAYKELQATKPQSLAYGLTDSPAGLAAWIVEKWRSWSDSGGDLDAHIDRDFLLELLTIYWATGCIGTSLRDYYDNRRYPLQLGPDDRVRVPTGIAVFSHQFVPEGDPPREWAERGYHVHRWTPMPRGGHFAAAEEPDLVAQDILAFFDSL